MNRRVAPSAARNSPVRITPMPTTPTTVRPPVWLSTSAVTPCCWPTWLRPGITDHAERCLGQPPRGVAGEADRHQDDEWLAEGLVQQVGDRPALVGVGLPAERDAQREDADHDVDHGAGDETRARERVGVRALGSLVDRFDHAFTDRFGVGVRVDDGSSWWVRTIYPLQAVTETT